MYEVALNGFIVRHEVKLQASYSLFDWNHLPAQHQAIVSTQVFDQGRPPRHLRSPPAPSRGRAPAVRGSAAESVNMIDRLSTDSLVNPGPARRTRQAQQRPGVRRSSETRTDPAVCPTATPLNPLNSLY